MPMIPTSVIMAILAVTFPLMSFCFFFRFPHLRVLNLYSMMMIGTVAVMIFTIALAVFAVHVVWLSWVQLAIAISLFITGIRQMRMAREVAREKQRAEAEHRAKGA
jgi:hypothetical protein